MTKKIFLFDNDGTLTTSGARASPEITRVLVAFADKFKMAIVTGSTWEDIRLLHDEAFLTHPSAEFALDMGSKVYSRGALVFERPSGVDFETFRPHMEHILANVPMKYGKHDFPEKTRVANRINFTTLGRLAGSVNPPPEICADYAAWDKQNGQRAWIIDYLEKHYPGHEITLGGGISIDITKEGCGKDQAVGYYRRRGYDSFFYFGDRIGVLGNDNAIAHGIVDAGGTVFAVESPAHTARIMRSIMENEQP
ncbi:MAG: hypothetical protein LBH41_00350 [Rickettsiales bacterium]|jgi:hydroxymethylpyrimidine pyrophosphatase-like HAD family hydrolase|nr:hypothetical protein [Rickettsiales bacterium]